MKYEIIVLIKSMNSNHSNIAGIMNLYLLEFCVSFTHWWWVDAKNGVKYQGSYFYLVQNDGATVSSGDEIELVSALLIATSNAGECLTFWYYMFQTTNTLEVILREGRISSALNIYARFIKLNFRNLNTHAEPFRTRLYLGLVLANYSCCETVYNRKKRLFVPILIYLKSQ